MQSSIQQATNCLAELPVIERLLKGYTPRAILRQTLRETSMNRLAIFKVVLISFAFVFSATKSFASCNQTLVGSQYDRFVDAGRINHDLFNAAVLILTNNERCSRGRSELRTTQSVFSAAVAHAEYMAENQQYDHVMNVRGARNVTEWLRRQNTSFRRTGENIDKHFLPILNGVSYIPLGNCNFNYTATGTRVPKHTYRTLAQTVVASWMGSPGHRANLLERRYDRMGAAFGLSRGGQFCGDLYISQVFAG